VAPAVAGFAHGALVDAMGRAAARFGVRPVLLEVDDLAGWAAAHRLKVVTAHPPIGPVAQALAAADVGAVRVARAWDRALWPHAGRGFFGFRPRIGDAVAAASGG
jgi:deoxyribodipyrimidine photo-lyase